MTAEQEQLHAGWSAHWERKVQVGNSSKGVASRVGGYKLAYICGNLFERTVKYCEGLQNFFL